MKRAAWMGLWVAAACASRAQAPAPPASAPAIAFIENDYPRALAEARARRLPLFIDAWASWCHTCLSLRNYVFPDPSLRPLAERFVWLSLDTERVENAGVVTRLGVRVLPTLYVLDPQTEKPALSWPGSLTARELTVLLEGGEPRSDGGEAESEATAALDQAQRDAAEGQDGAAIEGYRRALARAPSEWAARPQAIDGLVTRLAASRDLPACVQTAADEMSSLPPGTWLADVLRAGIGCAQDLPPSSPARSRLAEMTTFGEAVASDPSQPILADDRSDLYDYLVGAFRAMGRPDDVARAARSWAAFLDRAASRAATPAARSVFDAHRLLAYTALGEPERAIPVLQQSERDFPGDYNPPARLAVAWLAMKRYPEALSSVTRALDLAYGPRKLRLWSLEADIDEAMGDKRAAREALHTALEFAAKVPLSAGYGKLRAALGARMATLNPPD